MTILATPPDYSSVHGDLVYTVSDPHALDSVTYPNYKYIADVYVDSVLVARIKKVQDPTTGIGIFNIGQIVRNYLNTTFNPAPNVLQSQELGENEFFVSVVVIFGEEYDLSTFVYLVADSPRLFFNSYNGRLIDEPNLENFTDRPATQRPPYGDVFLATKYFFIPYFALTTTPIPITVTPTGGGSAFSATVTPSAGYGMQIINIAPVALNAAHAGAINASTTSYTVQVGSQTYTIKLICEPLHTPYSLHFLNQFGGFDTKLFTKASKITTENTRKDFGKLNYTVNGSGEVSYRNANNVMNESRSVYSVLYEQKLTLNSDFLTDWEYAWLNNLISSPLVYIEENSIFYPIIITDNNYETKKAIIDDLTNLTLTISYGLTQNAQFR